MSNVETSDNNLIRSSLVSLEKYNQIKESRLSYGKREFVLETPYIQKSDDAEELLGWVINRSMSPKKWLD